MSSTHIEIRHDASRLGAEWRALIDAARVLQAHATKVKDISDQVASGGDYAALATKLGIIAVEAEASYNLLGDFYTAVNVAAINTFIDRLG